MLSTVISPEFGAIKRICSILAPDSALIASLICPAHYKQYPLSAAKRGDALTLSRSFYPGKITFSLPLRCASIFA
ncbi:hypothetical protein KCP74_20495 [Salmonella enterica subsp. enterica]|nr:hypothetical protein KCP74_20495 [Salmonella enterica subsp. enterica]